MNRGAHSAATYEERALLFLDLLGFAERVRQSETNSGEQKRILRAIRGNIEELTPPLHDGSDGREVTVFSDSVAVSYPLAMAGAIPTLLMDAVFIQHRLLFDGFLTRGAVTTGLLNHSGPRIFGPAFLKAYELERGPAQYPRAILDEHVYTAALMNPLNPAEYEREFLDDYTKVDIDGWRYLDYLRQWGQLDDIETFYELLRRTRAMTESALTTQRKRKVRCKYQWLRCYLNRTVRDFQLPRKFLLGHRGPGPNQRPAKGTESPAAPATPPTDSAAPDTKGG